MRALNFIGSGSSSSELSPTEKRPGFGSGSRADSFVVVAVINRGDPILETDRD